MSPFFFALTCFIRKEPEKTDGAEEKKEKGAEKIKEVSEVTVTDLFVDEAKKQRRKKTRTVKTRRSFKKKNRICSQKEGCGLNCVIRWILKPLKSVLAVARGLKDIFSPRG